MASNGSSSAFRADHVGSFVRPKELLDARRGDTDPQRLHELDDRRGGFLTDLTDAVEGFDSEAVDTASKVWR